MGGGQIVALFRRGTVRAFAGKGYTVGPPEQKGGGETRREFGGVKNIYKIGKRFKKGEQATHGEKDASIRVQTIDEIQNHNNRKKG